MIVGLVDRAMHWQNLIMKSLPFFADQRDVENATYENRGLAAAEDSESEEDELLRRECQHWCARPT